MIPRLRQRVLSPPFRIGPPRWATESTFDLDFHLRHLRLTPPGDAPTLLDALQPIASSAFDRARPLWEFTLFEGLEGDRAALAMKVHHSITDGVGGMALLTELVDLEREPGELDDELDLPAVPAPETFGTVALVRDSISHTSRRMLGIARRTPGRVTSNTFAAVRDPAGAAANVAITARSISRLLAPATSPMSPLMVRPRARPLPRDVERRRSTTSAAPASRPRAASTTCSSPRSSVASTATTSATVS